VPGAPAQGGVEAREVGAPQAALARPVQHRDLVVRFRELVGDRPVPSGDESSTTRIR
jgi:hypothetical protein